MRKRTVIIGEIGINAGNSVDRAKELMKGIKDSQADYCKFQKRTIDLVYTKEELDRPRDSPYGTTNRQLKEALEFSEQQYDEIDRYSKEIGLPWFVSCWDLQSVELMKKYDLPCNKIASAMLTYDDLLIEIAKQRKYTYISTGLSDMSEVEHAVDIFRKYDTPICLLHCVGAYPIPNEAANLAVMKTLRHKFGVDVGWSDHTCGSVVSQAAVALGAVAIERHVTKNKADWGSDNAASLEIAEFARLISSIRTIEACIGSPEKKLYDIEIPIRAKLRRF